jgi:hypothetical protein
VPLAVNTLLAAETVCQTVIDGLKNFELLGRKVSQVAL